ncbi:MAG: (4Fe-4S)-binding protein [Bacteroidota bacterium]
MAKEYLKDDLTILWDSSKCTHSAVCAKGLPSVFKPRERPWIQVENESKETIRDQVLKCPSGALSLKRIGN